MKGKKRAHPVVYESELEDLHIPGEAHAHHGLNDDTIRSYDEDEITYNGNVEYDSISKHKQDLDKDDIAYKGKNDDDDMTSKYTATDPFGDPDGTTLRESITEITKSPKWQCTPLKKVIMIAICAYLTFRAIIGLTLAVIGLFNNTTPAPAPSLLFLLLLAIQIYISNRSLPRLLTLIYTISAVLASLAFLTVSYVPLTPLPSIPHYGLLSLTGGTCPVRASDCHSQTTHWTVLGCANYTYYANIESDDPDEMPTSQFYVPYETRWDINASANAVHVTEAVIMVLGTIWLLTVLLHIHAARHLFVPPSTLSNLLRPSGPNPRRGSPHSRSAMFTTMAAVLGILGAFIVAVMSVAAHVSQATGTPEHAATYIDSFGAGTWANFTRDASGVVIGTGWAGNATVWNDCFTVQAPAVGMGWGPWMAGNGWLGVVRIVAGL